MTNISQQLVHFARTIRAYVATRSHTDEAGASMVEYALLVALIAAACVGVLGTLSGGIQSLFTSVTSSL